MSQANETREAVKSLFGEVQLPRSHIALANSLADSVFRTIPHHRLSPPPESYFRAYSDEAGRPSLELSVLTKDRLVYDFVFLTHQHTLCICRLTPSSSITLRTYHSDDQDDPSHPQAQPPPPPGEPYRAELTIESDSTQLTYSAEGQRRSVASLIAYARAILRVLTHLE
jgi:hypothetical protein